MYRVSQKNWVLPNWSFADPSGDWWEILVTFSANLVEPVKSRVVGLVNVRIMLINHFYLCGFWYHELSWLLKICVIIRICQTANKSIEIDNSKHDSIGFATKITSISHQPPAGSANAQFNKTQFFLRHPVPSPCSTQVASIAKCCPSRLPRCCTQAPGPHIRLTSNVVLQSGTK